MSRLLANIRRADRPPFHALTPVAARAAYELGSEILELPRVGLARVDEIRVPASDGPKVSMIRATIWRDAHRPQACSGGRTALMLRKVAMLTAAAPRDRMDPRFGAS